jgi:hypothetical protein
MRKLAGPENTPHTDPAQGPLLDLIGPTALQGGTAQILLWHVYFYSAAF